MEPTSLSSNFSISPITALTQGVIAAGITIGVVLICAYAFRMGSSRQRKPPGEGPIPYLKSVYRSMRRRYWRFRKYGCRKPDKDDEEFNEDAAEEARMRALEDEAAPEGMVYIWESRLTFFGYVFLIGGCFVFMCCNLFALVRKLSGTNRLRAQRTRSTHATVPVSDAWSSVHY